MRTLGAAFLAVTLTVSSAFAAAQSVSPLPAGQPAGAQKAALLGPSLFLVLLSGTVLIGGLALAVSQNSGNDGVTTPTTSSTSTTSLP